VVIFFLQLPKTGGQTLSTRLAAWFPAGWSRVMLCEVATRDDLHALALAHDFVTSHPGYRSLADPPGAMAVLALVREPMAYMPSLYGHIRRDLLNSLHGAVHALAPIVFMDCFAHYLFDFQARGLAMAYGMPEVHALSRGEDVWIARHLEPAIDALRWLVPSEAIGYFYVLWHIETGCVIGQPDLVVNAAEPDALGLIPLRAWLSARPERFVFDSLLRRRAQQRFGAWPNALLARDRATGDLPPGQRAWSAPDGAALWLVRDWQPPEPVDDGAPYWWSGPGFFLEMRLRRRSRSRLKFDAFTFLGVHWGQVSYLARGTRAPLTHSAMPQVGESYIGFSAALDGLAEEAAIVTSAIENVAAVPPLPIALQSPRRGFATRRWRLS
jgi:hypothetical protein